ncbi:WG repeat-containing protein [Aquimarina celericrescens]|uniref:WG repeat-containing protein n=1 Tax=Aquimarina celericrescens TaxID=1964542 RepID=A0ABW5AV20_9FLAO|nr:WG repeat-containing protein [Aquimarina celericrescens]
MTNIKMFKNLTLKSILIGLVMFACSYTFGQNKSNSIPKSGYYVIDSLSHNIPQDIMRSVKWSISIDSLPQQSYYILETKPEASFINAYALETIKKDSIDFRALKIMDGSDNTLRLIDENQFVIQLNMSLSLTEPSNFAIKMRLKKVAESDALLANIKTSIEESNRKKKKEKDRLVKNFLSAAQQSTVGYVTAIDISDYGLAIPLLYTTKSLRESGEKTSLYALKKDSFLGGITFGMYNNHFYGHTNIGVVTSKKPITIADYIAVAPNYRQEEFYKSDSLLLYRFFEDYRFIAIKKIDKNTYAIAEAESENKNIQELKEYYSIFNSINTISKVNTLDLKSLFLKKADFLETDKEKNLFLRIEKEVNQEVKEKMEPHNFVTNNSPDSFYLEEFNTYAGVFSITDVSIKKVQEEVLKKYPEASVILKTKDGIVLQLRDKGYRPFIFKQYQGYTLLFQIKEGVFSKSIPLKIAVKFYQVTQRLTLKEYPIYTHLKPYFNKFQSAYRDRIDSTYIFIKNEGWNTRGILSDKGNIVLAPKYEDIRSYENGFMITIDSLVHEGTKVEKKKEYTGWANRKGKIILKPIYKNLYPIEKTPLLSVRDSLYGIFDVDMNQMIIPLSYESIIFHKEAQRIELQKESEEYFLADYKGAILHKEPFKDIRVLGKEAPVTFMATRNDKDFFIDRDGKPVNDNRYDMLYPHYKEKVVYYRIGSYNSVDNEDGYLDYQGNIVEEFSRICKDINRKITTRPKEVFIADLSGKKLHKSTFKNVFRIPGKPLFIVTQGKKMFITDDLGMPINKKRYDQLFPVVPRKRIFYRIGKKGEDNTKQGYLDFNGNEIE